MKTFFFPTAELHLLKKKKKFFQHHLYATSQRVNLSDHFTNIYEFRSHQLPKCKKKENSEQPMAGECQCVYVLCGSLRQALATVVVLSHHFVKNLDDAEAPPGRLSLHLTWSISPVQKSSSTKEPQRPLLKGHEHLHDVT